MTKRDELIAPGATTKSDGGTSTEFNLSDLKTSPELLALLERAKNHVMTPEEIHEQRRSFVRGMCPNNRDYKEWCAQIDKLVPPLSPSDPSSTRSEVTVEGIARIIALNDREMMPLWDEMQPRVQRQFLKSARALLDQFEIRRK